MQKFLSVTAAVLALIMFASLAFWQFMDFNSKNKTSVAQSPNISLSPATIDQKIAIDEKIGVDEVLLSELGSLNSDDFSAKLQTELNAGLDSNSSLEARSVPRSDCPIDLPLDYTEITYLQSDYTKTWQAKTNKTCKVAAQELILGFESAGFNIQHADYLGLSAESWGCVVQTQDSSVLMVALVPKNSVLPRDEQNLLVLHVILFDAGALASIDLPS